MLPNTNQCQDVTCEEPATVRLIATGIAQDRYLQVDTCDDHVALIALKWINPEVKTDAD